MRPNIVFIVADDLGYADLSCCGRRDFSTPNIDRIAERGLRFTQAYANSAVCSATRLALITGHRPPRHEGRWGQMRQATTAEVRPTEGQATSSRASRRPIRRFGCRHTQMRSNFVAARLDGM